MEEENSSFLRNLNNDVQQIKSDAFLKGKPNINNYAEIHQILHNNLNFYPDLSMIYFSNLNELHLNDIMTLHREWFPVRYTKDYILNFLNNSSENIAIGCFIKINGNEYMIASILCNFYHENKFHNLVPKVFKSRLCFSRLFFPYVFGYIATLGVIDEFRRFGIARMLIEQAIEMMKRNKRCVGVFLNVIEYNKSAIKLYNCLDFIIGNIKTDYYCINDAYFNSEIFYKVISNPEMFSNKKAITNNESNDIVISVKSR